VRILYGRGKTAKKWERNLKCGGGVGNKNQLFFWGA